jgi:hypothetical protein
MMFHLPRGTNGENVEGRVRREAARSLVGNQASTAKGSAFGEANLRAARVKRATRAAGATKHGAALGIIGRRTSDSGH